MAGKEAVTAPHPHILWLDGLPNLGDCQYPGMALRYGAGGH
jgi:hypothetical protein